MLRWRRWSAAIATRSLATVACELSGAGSSDARFKDLALLCRQLASKLEKAGEAEHLAAAEKAAPGEWEEELTKLGAAKGGP